jgi:hypothetical protein
VLPNESDVGHWGFASVGGQLGGFDLNTLTLLTSGESDRYLGGVFRQTYDQGEKLQQSNCCNQRFAFGTFANGGNAVPYAPLELWVMGLLSDSELSVTQIAREPSEFDPMNGTFKAKGWDMWSAERIRLHLGRNAPCYDTAQKNYHAVPLLLSTKEVLEATTLARV